MNRVQIAKKKWLAIGKQVTSFIASEVIGIDSKALKKVTVKQVFTKHNKTMQQNDHHD